MLYTSTIKGISVEYARNNARHWIHHQSQCSLHLGSMSNSRSRLYKNCNELRKPHLLLSVRTDNTLDLRCGVQVSAHHVIQLCTGVLQNSQWRLVSRALSESSVHTIWSAACKAQFCKDCDPMSTSDLIYSCMLECKGGPIARARWSEDFDIKMTSHNIGCCSHLLLHLHQCWAKNDWLEDTVCRQEMLD